MQYVGMEFPTKEETAFSNSNGVRDKVFQNPELFNQAVFTEGIKKVSQLFK
jgi:hypothetical protein